MPVYLPPILAAVARCAARDHTRWAVGGVQVVILDGGRRYRVSATDARKAIIVQGNTALYEEDVPVDEAAEAVIRTDDWLKGLALGKDDRRGQPVRLAIAGNQFTFSFGGNQRAGEIVAGRFPPVLDLFQCRPLLSVRFDAGLLAELLATFAQLGCGQVNMLWYGAGKPVGVCAVNDVEQAVDGLIMPLDPPPPPPKAEPVSIPISAAPPRARGRKDRGAADIGGAA